MEVAKNTKNVVANMKSNKMELMFFLDKIAQSVANLCNNHQYLLNPTDGIERQCHFRIAKKLAEILEPIQEGYFVDCEYNKNGNETKLTFGKMWRPDIIYHARTPATSGNIFVVEIKPNDLENDLCKVYKYLNEPKLMYKYGFCISNITSDSFIIHNVRKNHVPRDPSRGYEISFLYNKNEGRWDISKVSKEIFAIT